MRKALKFIVPTLCVLIVIITFYMIFDIQNKVEKENYNTNNVFDEENIVSEENVVDVENEINENTSISNTSIKADDENIVTNDNVVAEEDDVLSTTNQDRALQIVKEYWGEDNTVYFTNEGVDSQGKYTVAVRQKTSTAVKNYFKVDLETKQIEIEY